MQVKVGDLLRFEPPGEWMLPFACRLDEGRGHHRLERGALAYVTAITGGDTTLRHLPNGEESTWNQPTPRAWSKVDADA